jgi:hypothetical protein
MPDDSPELLSSVTSPSDLGHEVAEKLIERTNRFLERYSDDALQKMTIWIVAISYVFDESFCSFFLRQLLQELKLKKHVFILLRSEQMQPYQMETLKTGLINLAEEYGVGMGVLSSPLIHAKGVGVFLNAPFYKDELGVVAALGSMNFTESSMNRSHEMMVILKDEQSIQRFFKTFLKMLGKNKGTFLYLIDENGTVRETPLKRFLK